MVAVRLHLDESTEENGPLHVIPSTHRLGVLSDDAVSEIAVVMRARAWEAVARAV